MANEPGRGRCARWRGTAHEERGNRDGDGSTMATRLRFGAGDVRNRGKQPGRIEGSPGIRFLHVGGQGGGSSTTDRSDGRNSSGGRQWQDRFWRIRPGSSSTRGLRSWKRWRGRCSCEESRRGCRRWSESTSEEGSSVRSEPEEMKEKAACADKAHGLFRRHQNLPSTGMARRVSGRSESTTTA